MGQGSDITFDSAEKPPSRFFSFLTFGALADEEEFVAGVHLPLDDFARLDVDGGGQRQRQVDIALGDGFLAADGLDLSGVVHVCILVN
jgi:hypothetical protein